MREINLEKNTQTHTKTTHTKKINTKLVVYLKKIDNEFNFNSVCFLLFCLIVGSPVWKPRDMINLNDAQSTARNKDDK